MGCEYTLYEVTEKKPPYTPVFVGSIHECAKFTGLTETQIYAHVTYQQKAKSNRTTFPYLIRNVGRFKEKGKHRKRPDTEMVEVKYFRDGEQVTRIVDRELYEAIRSEQCGRLLH